MTVAAAIAIGAEGTLASSQGKALGAAHDSKQAGAMNQSSSQPTVQAAGDFRSGLQSLLASLATSTDGFGETVAEGDQEPASAEPALPKATGDSSAVTPASTTGAALRLRLGTEQGSGEAGAESKLSSAAVLNEAFAAQSVAGVSKATASKTEEKSEADGSGTGSSHSARSTRSARTSKSEDAAAAPLPGLVPAASAAPPQAIPPADIASPVLNSTDAPMQPASLKDQTEISADSFTSTPTGFTSAAVNASSLQSEASSKAGDSATVARLQAAGGYETSARRTQASPVSSPSGVSGDSLSETEAAPANESAHSPAATRVEAANLPDLPAASQSLPQEASHSPVDAQAPDQSLVLPSTASLAQSPTLAQGQGETPAQSGSQGAGTFTAPLANGESPLPIAAAANISSSDQLPVASRTQGRSSLSEKKTSATDALRSSHETGSAASVPQGGHLVQAQSSGSTADASAALQSIAGAGGAAHTASELTARTAVASGGSDSRETFATLDARGTTGKPAWIHVEAQRAEAGFQDPDLGWVGVRADSSGGGVRAELVAGSADAAQALGGHLAGLNAYLAEHHTPVETLTLTSSQGGWSGSGSDTGAGQGMQQGTGQQAGQQTEQSAGSSFSTSSDRATPSTTEGALPSWSAGRNGSVEAATPEGAHISVVA